MSLIVSSEKIFVKLYLLVLLYIVGLNAEAFDVPMSPVVTTFNKHEYGAFSKNWSVCHDEEGNVYFGNDSGLLWYNGASWSLHVLPSKTKVRAVYLGSDGCLYSGSYEEFGYWKYDEYGKIYYTSLSDSIPGFTFHNEDIWKIVEDDNGSIYFQSFSTIFKYDGKQVKYIKPGKGGVSFLLKARGKIVASFGRGNISELVDFQFKEIPNSDILYSSQIRTFLPWGDKGFLLGSARYGLFLQDDSGIHPWNCPANDAIKEKQINCGVFNGSHYFIGTIHDGLYMINVEGEVVFHFNGTNYLPDNNILGLDINTDGSIMVAMSKGISIIDLKHPINYFNDEDANLGVVYDAVVFEDDLYLATNLGVFRKPIESVFTSPTLEGFEVLEELRGQNWSFFIDKQNDCLLVGHNKGTFRISKKGIERLSRIGGGYSFQLFDFDDHKYLLQNNYTSISVFNQDKDGQWIYAHALKGYSEPTACLVTDIRNNLWASHSRTGELYKITLGRKLVNKVKVKQYKQEDGLPSEFGIRVFKINQRVVFTTGSGIYTYDDLKDSIVMHPNLNRQLNEFKNAKRIILQRENRYWFLLPRKIGLFEIGDKEVKKVLEYNFNDQSISLPEQFENIIPISGKYSIICLENGIALLNNNLSEYQSESIELRFTGITYGYRNLNDIIYPVKDEPEYLSIPYNNNRVKFELGSNCPIGKRHIYKYRLVGLEDNWHVLSNSNVIEYSRLPSGVYKLQVKAYNEFGIEVSSRDFQFGIIPRWYTHTWVIVLFVTIFLLIVVITIFYFHRYHVKKRLNMQIAHEEELHKIQEEQLLLTEKEIVKLRNDNLRNDLAFKSNQLASATMASIRKNEVLIELRNEIMRQKELLQYRYPEKYFEKIIRMIDRNLENNEDWATFEKYFDQAHVNFFSRLKDTHSTLTPKDLRLCAYLKMNLTTKEIAHLLSVSPRSVEVHRYRLRKRLGLDSSDNLTEYLIAF